MEATMTEYVEMFKELIAPLERHAKVIPAKTDEGSNYVFHFVIETQNARANLAISWEAMVAAYSTPAYRNGPFRSALQGVVQDLLRPSEAKNSYVISTRGLRREPAETDIQTLDVYAGLEEAVKIGEDFEAMMKRGAA